MGTWCFSWSTLHKFQSWTSTVRDPLEGVASGEKWWSGRLGKIQRPSAKFDWIWYKVMPWYKTKGKWVFHQPKLSRHGIYNFFYAKQTLINLCLQFWGPNWILMNFCLTENMGATNAKFGWSSMPIDCCCISHTLNALAGSAPHCSLASSLAEAPVSVASSLGGREDCFSWSRNSRSGRQWTNWCFLQALFWITSPRVAPQSAKFPNLLNTTVWRIITVTGAAMVQEKKLTMFPLSLSPLLLLPLMLMLMADAVWLIGYQLISTGCSQSQLNLGSSCSCTPMAVCHWSPPKLKYGSPKACFPHATPKIERHYHRCSWYPISVHSNTCHGVWVSGASSFDIRPISGQS